MKLKINFLILSVKSLYLQDRENRIRNIRKGNIEVLYNKEDEDWEEIENQ